MISRNFRESNLDWNNLIRPPGAGENIICLNPRVARWEGGKSGMTEGETRFYLREIHSHWTTPRISSERVAELLAAKLIEHSTEAVGMIRLTHSGLVQKNASRQRKSNSTLSLVRKPDNSQRGRRSHLAPPRPLV